MNDLGVPFSGRATLPPRKTPLNTPLPLRVAHIPGSHPYARHLSSGAGHVGAPFIGLDDVIPAGRATGEWWPPVMLDPAWIEAHAGDFDVMHVHFGFESFSAEHLESCVAALRLVDRPLVLTVHDLENPQLLEQASHERNLEVLVRGATAVTTLTEGAAREIASRWGREATVIRHPHVLDIDDSSVYEHSVEEVPDPATRATAVIGMHLGDIRPSIDPVRATATLIGSIMALRADGMAVEAEVHVRDSVRDAGARDAVVSLVRGAAGVSIVQHPRLADADLARSLAALDACVLPYRHGTHSGWLELCFDLGVPVLAPAIGHWLDQHPVPGAAWGFDPGSVSSLAAAISHIVGHRGESPRSVIRSQRREDRRLERDTISDAHTRVYRAALAASVPV